MNTYFYFEGRIFETLHEVQDFRRKNCPNGRIDEIYTSKDFEEFENEFNKAKEEGNSDLDAIELAK